MNHLKNNLYFKIGGIVLIALILLIPTGMISSIVSEREQTQADAIYEVSSKWGREQTIQGPVLSIPYTYYTKEVERATGKEKLVQLTQHLHVLPNELKINATVNPEKRNRGIYDIVVYTSEIQVEGAFDLSDIKDLESKGCQFKLNEATLETGLDDLRGIEKQIQLNWDSSRIPFEPGLSSEDLFSSGINALVPISKIENTRYQFSFGLALKGSQKLYFTPVGKVTDITMNSNWQSPSFDGSFLPDQHQITKKGFHAHWNILNLNRNYPQSWTGSRYDLDDSAFGVDLILPVDNYQKAHRSMHYAILFIGLTFLVFFFIEIFQSAFIHPIQYILVGVALVVFYTLLLSFSEYLKFNYAFILAALATLLLIAGYVRAILKSIRLTGLIVGLLSILYIFIFIIIQLEDIALLVGSIGVFIILALIMYFSRKIDWYTINKGKSEN